MSTEVSLTGAASSSFPSSPSASSSSSTGLDAVLMPPPSAVVVPSRPSWLDAWLSISSQVGKRVGQTHFVPFKSPITNPDYAVPSTKSFSVKDVVAQVRGQQELGVVVDLTEDELIGADEWKAHNIQRIRLSPSSFLTKSVDSQFPVPNPEILKAFSRIVDSFTKNSNKMVGVCCVDGFVLTGFLIVGYMVEEGCSLETALVQFAKARPPGLFHWPYIEFLQKHFNEPEQKRPVPPAWASTTLRAIPRPPPPAKPLTLLEQAKLKRRIPKRKAIEEPGATSTNTTTATQPAQLPNVPASGARPCRPPPDSPFFVSISEPEASQIGAKVEALLKSAQQGSDPFFGNTRVELQKSALPLNPESMTVTWKPVGLTLVLAVLTEGSYFLSQLKEGYGVWKCPELNFKQRKAPTVALDGTVVIGELVVDVVEEQSTPRYLMRDLMFFAGTSLMQRSLNTRQQCINAELLTPWSQQAESKSSRLRLRSQLMYPLNKASAILNMKISHETRGLVFIPSKGPYGSPLLEWDSEGLIPQADLLESLK